MVIKQVNIEMLILSFLVLWGVSCTTSVKDEEIPVTTESESARLLYLRADALFEKVYISEAVTLLEEALLEVPNFSIGSILSLMGFPLMQR